MSGEDKTMPPSTRSGAASPTVSADRPDPSSAASPIAPPQISLPTGGGAIRGVGEKFTANPVTGSGAMSVPIAVSKGRSGFGPSLSLAYDSSRGASPFGWGWSMSLPAITRKTDKGLPLYQDARDSDVFILAGAEDLVPALAPDPQTPGGWRKQITDRALYGRSYRVARYRPRVEAGFAVIERWTGALDPTDVFWRTISRDNVTSWFGLTAQDRVADPADPSRIFSWLISRSHDDRGNLMVFGYKAEDSQGVDRSLVHERNRTPLGRSAQRYIKTITYGARTPYWPDLTGAAPTPLPTDWCFTVVFDYGEHDLVAPTVADTAQPWTCRPDPFSTYRQTFEVRTYRLCRRVLMFHDFPDVPAVGAARLVRSTDLTHTATPGPDPSRPAYAYLTSVTQRGYGDGPAPAAAAYPPIAFTYSEAVIDETVRELDADSLRNLPEGLGGGFQWVDLDGEGLAGVLARQGGGWSYKANLSAANVSGVGDQAVTRPRFAPQSRVETLPAPAAMDSRQQLLPLSGDGQLSLVSFDDPAPGYFERTARGGWAAFVPFRSLPRTDWRDPNLRFIDLTGDGFPDVLITDDTAFTWHESLSTEGFAAGRRAPAAHDEEMGPRLVFADAAQSIFLGDMSGDGLTDLVRVRVGEVCYWPNLGYGRFGPKVTMDGVGLIDRPDQFDPRRARLADIDGSGALDLLYFAAGEIRLWFNASGNALAARRTLAHFPGVDTASTAQVVDLLGAGTACLVWSSPLPATARTPMRYIDLMGGQKPHLLLRVDNNMGAETTLQWAPSTKFYVADKLAGTPWITRLPFPVHVVEQIEVVDRVARNRFSTRYAYHHGYFDGVEREFRGFARVDQWDCADVETMGATDYTAPPANESAASSLAPVLTRTWFHTGFYVDGGAITDALRAEYASEVGGSGPGLADSALPDGLTLADGSRLARDLSPEERREACRALRGSMMRQEVFAQDGSAAASRPYRTTEQNFTLQMLQPRGPNPFGVFMTHARETLTVDYERAEVLVSAGALADPAAPAPGDHLAADPRVGHVAVLATNGYGDVLKSVSLVYGRRYRDPALTPEDQARQGALLATAKVDTYTNAVATPDANRLPLPAQADAFELLQLAPTPPTPGVTTLIDFATLAARFDAAGDGAHDIPYEDDPPPALTPGVPYRRLTNRTRTLYRPDDLGQAAGDPAALLPLGALESAALAGSTCTLVLTPGLISKVFVRGGPLVPTPATVLASVAPDGGGYVDLDGDGAAWAPSTRIHYAPAAVTPAQELGQARAHFFLPRRFVDPFGAASVVDYDDPHDLLPATVTDPVGNQVQAVNDYRVLAPVLITDPNGNQTAARYDALGLAVGSAVMGKAGQATGDSVAAFDADLTQAAIDAFFAADDATLLAPALLGTATSRVVHDVGRFQASRLAAPADPAAWQPVWAATLARVTHQADLAPGAVSEIQITFSYSDGFGREVQKKVAAEPAVPPAPGQAAPPRWVGSGWVILDNKGNPVRRYEPFFSALPTRGHQFEFAAASGVSDILCYDPLGRVTAIVHPDHSWEKAVFGPWAQTRWDGNDTVAIDDPAADPDVGGALARLPAADLLPTWRQQRASGALGPAEQAAAVKAAAHAATPAVSRLDSLGRVFLTVADNGGGVTFTTRVDLDIAGREQSTTDALGRQTTACAYDLRGARLYHASMDAGRRWSLADCLGKPIRGWDDRGHNRRTAYDALRRPTAQYVRGTDAAQSDPRTLTGEILHALTIYGEGQVNDQTLNLRTRIFLQRGPSGEIRNSAVDPATGQEEAYDIKGGLLRTTRRFVVAYDALTDWSGAAPVLGPAYATAAAYDALGRVIVATTPDGAVTRAAFNSRDLLDSLEVTLSGAAAPTPVIVSADYDAKGRRVSVTQGDAGTITARAYDPLTQRLAGLTTTRPAAPADRSTVQALTYVHDPVGNITHIQDDADLQNTVYFRNRRVEPSADYLYDPVYRLIAATGREQLGLAGAGVSPPQPTRYNDAGRVGLPLPGDGAAMGIYAEQYAYDGVGNLLSLTHRGSNPANPGWTRTYAYAEASLIDAADVSNRLTRTVLGGGGAAIEAYAYDPHGSMTAMPQLQAMTWDAFDQLLSTRRQAVDAADADGAAHQGERTWYVYGPGGERVRKATVSSTGALMKQRFYLGGWELYQEYDAKGGVTLERQTLSVADGSRRALIVDTRTIDASAPAGSGPVVTQRYPYDNHIGSACLELDQTGAVITYEEYFPYGGTSYQGGASAAEVSLKRYRYCGLERDEETGLACHGARYYAPWLGRWTACDPAGEVDGPNLYLYCRGNPLTLTDPGGRQSTPTAQGSEPQIKYHPFPTIQERVAGALGDYHLSLDPPKTDTPFKPLSFSALMKAVYGFDPSSLPSWQPPDAGAPDYIHGPTIPPAPAGPSLLPFSLGPLRVDSEGGHLGSFDIGPDGLTVSKDSLAGYRFRTALHWNLKEETATPAGRFIARAYNASIGAIGYLIGGFYLSPKGDIDINRSLFYDNLRETPSYLQDMMANRQNAYTGIDAKSDPYLNLVINTLGVPTTQYDNRARSPGLVPLFTIDPSINVGFKVGKNRATSIGFVYSPGFANNVIGLSPLFPETQGKLPGGDMLLQLIGHQPNTSASSYFGFRFETPLP